MILKALQWVGTLADFYAPGQRSKVLSAFRGRRDTVIDGKEHTLLYEFDGGDDFERKSVLVMRCENLGERR